MSYVGNTPTTQSFISGTDYFNGTGSQTAFTLSRTVVSPNDVEAVINNVVQQPNSAYTISGTTITFTSAPSAGTSNIYVRYLSTTTQSITPSQNTVSYSTLNSDNQSKLGISFKNRIINGAMTIDQRNAGASVTNTSGGTQYTVDRWQIYGDQASKFSVQQNAGSVTPPAGFTYYAGITSLSAYSVGSSEAFLFRQKIEGFNTSDLGFGTANAKNVTVSFWVRSSLTGTFGAYLINNAYNRSYPFGYTISAANTWTQISVTIPGDTSGTWATDSSTGIQLGFSLGCGSSLSNTANAWYGSAYYQPTGAVSLVGTSGATLYITGISLEVGTQATTFDYRSYGTELQLCYRYFVKYGGTGNYEYINFSPFIGSSSTVAYGCVTSPVPMRTVPSYSGSNLRIVDESGAWTVTSITSSGATYGNNFGAEVAAQTASGLVQYRPYFLQTNGSTASNYYMYMSAEL